MLLNNKKTAKKIYVLCPANIKSGGPELLHQLVYQINRLSNSKMAYIVYLNRKKNNPVVPEYRKYLNNKWIGLKDIEDNKSNIIVFPEVFLDLFNNFSHAHKYIWWLSVEGYLQNTSVKHSYKIYGFLRTIKRLMLGEIKKRDNLIKNADLNLCQSYYAEKYLLKKGIAQSKIVYLSDYINDLYVNQSNESLHYPKENLVLFNPKKGFRFTKKIMKESNGKFKWVALQNMSNDEILKNLKLGKVYIDFGFHPGKDRFPREAAICSCCIITDKKGSAKYKQDVDIPEAYKFEDNAELIPKILSKIEYCLFNYKEAINDFEIYRNKIRSEKSQFINDCKNIFL